MDLDLHSVQDSGPLLLPGAVLVFDDVVVPWEHVFVYKSVERVTAQFHESPAHVTANFQSCPRWRPAS